ncbi:hypothetical protein SNEBB_011022 [Seison nebaliae]|nr:hypothetical protein SNEBB_011022 [Seison nebaliae]
MFDCFLSSITPTSILFSTIIGILFYFLFFNQPKLSAKHPPFIPSTIPFLGHAVSFGKNPVEFLLAAYKEYGPVFSFEMVGKKFTYLVGAEASALLFNSRNEALNAEDVYSKLVTPVFGKGVAYDVPNARFLEQKKIFKNGLNIERFRKYIPIIQEETKIYFRQWNDEGERNIFDALSELIIMTASNCLHGPEIRSVLDGSVAHLYTDLDNGFTQLAWLLPAWTPLPSFRVRDQAHLKIKAIFYKAINKRIQSLSDDKNDTEYTDMLQTLIEAKYKNGQRLTHDEIAGMLIGLLMAGQHTSSTTTAWLLFFLAANPSIQEDVLNEMKEFIPLSTLANLNNEEEYEEIDYDQLQELKLMDRCLKETLRLRPPIVTLMRLAKKDLDVLNQKYIIPEGHQVCVSPTTNHRLPDIWDENETFKPNRFLDSTLTGEDKFAYVPFGAGRHRCIGESFAYIQIKTIITTLLSKYEFFLTEQHRFPPVNFNTMIHTPFNAIIGYRRRILKD